MAFDVNDFGGRLGDAEAWCDFHRRARDDHRFATGYDERQWNPGDVAKLKEDGRAPITINQVGQVINAVSGSEVVQRYVASFLPRNADVNDIDQMAAEAFELLHKQAHQACDAEQAESQAFTDTVTTGIGWMETYLDYERHADGMVVSAWVPLYEVAADPHAKASNLTDARWIVRGKWIPRVDFEMSWPEHAKEGVVGSLQSTIDFPSGFLGIGKSVRNGDYVPNARWNSATGSLFYDKMRDRVLVYEHQFYEKENQYRAQIPQIAGQMGLTEFPVEIDGRLQVVRVGERFWLPDADYDQVMGMLLTALPGLTEADMIYSHQPRRLYKQQFWAGNILLQDEPLPVDAFTYQAITGLKDQSEDGGVSWYGLVANMKDPQRLANKTISSIATLIATNPNAFFYEEGVFVDEDAGKRDITNPSRSVAVTRGALENRRLQRKIDNDPIPQGMEGLLSFAMAAVPQVANQSQYAMGSVGDLRRTPAQAVQSVQRQAAVALSPLFDSLRLYRKTNARIVIQLAQRTYDDDRIARIVGQQYAPLVPLLKSRDVFDMDIIVDEEPNTPNAQTELRADLMQTNILPQILQQGYMIPPKLWGYLGLPGPVAQQFQQMSQLLWEQMFNPQQQVGPDGQPIAQQPGSVQQGVPA